MTLWYKAFFNGAKTHYIPSELLSQVLEDMSSRGLPLQHMEATKIIFADFGGMGVKSAPTEIFDAAGVSLVIPASHVCTLARILSETSHRMAYDGTYYKKVHLNHQCLVLTTDQRWALSEQVSARKSVANFRQEEFMASFVGGPTIYG